MNFVDHNDVSIFHISNSVTNGLEFEIEKSKDELLIDVVIKKLPLNSGIYKFHLFCSNTQEVFDEINFAGALKVEGGNFFPSGKLPNPKVTKVLVENSWTKLS